MSASDNLRKHALDGAWVNIRLVGNLPAGSQSAPITNKQMAVAVFHDCIRSGAGCACLRHFAACITRLQLQERKPCQQRINAPKGRAARVRKAENGKI